METSPSSPGLSPGSGEPRTAFRKSSHDTSQRNYRRRSPSASTSPSPPPAGGWKRDRSASPTVPGDEGLNRSQDHSKKERRLNVENDGHRDADPSGLRKGDSAPGPSETHHRGHTNDSFARPDDHGHTRRGSHHDRTYSNHSTYSGRNFHGEARGDYLSRQDGKLDDRNQDRGYRDRNNGRRRSREYDRERDRNRNRDRDTGREPAWDRSRERERDRDRERGRDWGRNVDADQDRDKRARPKEREQLKSREDYRDRDRRRDRSHKDLDDHRERQDDRHRDRSREKPDHRDRAGLGENRETDDHRQVADSRRQTRPREREEHSSGHHGRRPSGPERSGKDTANVSRPSEQERDASGSGVGWDRRTGNISPSPADGEKQTTVSDGDKQTLVDDGQVEAEAQGKHPIDVVKETDANGTAGSEQSGEGKTSPPKTVVGDVQHETARPESPELGELASSSSAQLESKKTGGEGKSSKSSKWGPEANLKTQTPAASADVNNDLSIAKLAALKAAEMVNKNLGVAGVMSADQKKKLLWGSKRKDSEQSAPNQEPVVLAGTNRWDTVHFADRDRQEKFHKLMGVKGDHKEGGEPEVGVFTEEKQRELQQDLEKIYTAGLRRRDGRTVGLGL